MSLFKSLWLYPLTLTDRTRGQSGLVAVALPGEEGSGATPSTRRQESIRDLRCRSSQTQR